MTNEEKIQFHKKILKEIHEMYLKKNRDYGDSVSKTYEKYGMVSFLVRMEDKLNRVKTLTEPSTREVEDERVEDSLLDLANYAILAAMEFSNDRGERRKKENSEAKERSLPTINYSPGKIAFSKPPCINIYQDGE